ncbi:DUF4832 domain-containing protein [Subtercola endophyticus]|uniref:DUF4832 domain-containing protein n=1 Tax=Subtercola endophyticus TaxID=2895559 RepID=UPI001E556FE9|nr:DUF4832 domain-containing protein [Subtercola endophyticus]UFS57562.1 DUF4832 domain-containing protein [Subtercola endophyticus]
MVTASLVITVAAIVIGLATPAMAAVGGSVDDPTQTSDSRLTYTYQASDADIKNPERGLYTSFNSTWDMTDSRLANVAKNGQTIVHFGIDLSDYRTRVIDTTLQLSIQAAFDGLRKYGLKGWVHITYSPDFDPNAGPNGTKYLTSCLDPTKVYPVDQVPSNVDTTLAWVQTHLSELKGTLAHNDDAIMGFDAGMIGEWGEWHCSAHQLLAPGNKEKVIAALLENLPADKQIALRHPYDVIDPAVYGVQGPSITWSDASSRFTDYQDCYASLSPSDEGTWVTNLTNEPKADQAEISKLKADIGVLGESHIIGGNACRSSERSTCPVAVTGSPDPGDTTPFPLLADAPELPNMHFTYLNGSMNPKETANSDYVEGGCWEQITNDLGYRLQLTSAELPATVAPDATEHVTIALANVGWASIVHPRAAYLVLDGASGKYRIPLVADPRSWAAGSSSTIDEDVTMPADLAVGEYSAALWLPDASDTLRDDPSYAVQFANSGTWNAAEGYNVLGTVSVAASIPTPTPTPTPAQTPNATPVPAAAAATAAPAASAALAATGYVAAPSIIALGVAAVALIVGAMVVSLRSRRRT